MVAKESVEAQLKRLGVSLKGWGSGELNELKNILMPHEEITAHSHGWYENGFGTLIATTERLLLIDKKLFHLSIDDVRYDMIAEVTYNARLIDATTRINTMNKTLRFTSMKAARLRALTNYVQARVMELRQQMFTMQQFEQANASPRGGGFQLTPQLAATQASVPMHRMTTANPYAKSALTTRHQFLPKVPRRWRPSS